MANLKNTLADSATSSLLKLADKGLLPDAAVRSGINTLAKTRLQEIGADDCELSQQSQLQFVQMMRESVIAPVPQKANEQHYEIPQEFFGLCLGLHRKYSSCLWLPDTTRLDEAEHNALSQTCSHAQLHDGQEILELGCGWGSLTLWMAQHYPQAKITGVSNSHSQRAYILNEAKKRHLSNIEIITMDMNVFDTLKRFDRVVSVEMFEHMRNYEVLYKKVATWLKPDGLFFKHIFVHRSTPYLFEVKNSNDWMSAHFFSGGMMPSDDLPLYFQDDLALINKWRWDGCHYEKTANAWLENLDINVQEVRSIFEKTYGSDANMWMHRWRIFFMACAELFGFNNGQEWWISHYLFKKRVV